MGEVYGIANGEI
jgi:hypothetical protein